MRVLWITHIAPPQIAAAFGIQTGPGGSWIPALADALHAHNDVNLGVAVTAGGGESRRAVVGAVTAYRIPVPGSGRRVHTGVLDSRTIHAVRKAIDDFRPDLVHVHGTEHFHGILPLRGVIHLPVIISVQGLVSAYERHYYGGLSCWQVFRARTLRDWLRFDGLFEQRRRMQKQARRELEILNRNSYFAGRTDWDRSHVFQANPNARYYEVGEVLRAPFYTTKWTPRSAVRHSIFCSSASYPLKGFHVLLKAAATLRRQFPDLQVRVAAAPFLDTSPWQIRGWRAGGYAGYLKSLAHSLDLGHSIIPLGRLDAQQFASELARAHVFALPSFIENSPNSLAESMIVGTPAVTSFVGGVPSMVQNDHTALCCPPGDEVSLASQIRRIFMDDELAVRLSCAGRELAQARHSPDTVVTQLLDAYSQVIDGGQTSAPNRRNIPSLRLHQQLRSALKQEDAGLPATIYNSQSHNETAN